jgi:hypothetical protein
MLNPDAPIDDLEKMKFLLTSYAVRLRKDSADWKGRRSFPGQQIEGFDVDTFLARWASEAERLAGEL